MRMCSQGYELRFTRDGHPRGESPNGGRTQMSGATVMQSGPNARAVLERWLRPAIAGHGHSQVIDSHVTPFPPKSGTAGPFDGTSATGVGRASLEFALFP